MLGVPWLEGPTLRVGFLGFGKISKIRVLDPKTVRNVIMEAFGGQNKNNLADLVDLAPYLADLVNLALLFNGFSGFSAPNSALGIQR